MTTTPFPSVIVEPNGQTTSVNFAPVSAGVGSTVYSDRFGMSSVSLPATISARTTYFLPAGTWTATVNGFATTVNVADTEATSTVLAPAAVTVAQLQTWYLDSYSGTDDQKMAAALTAWVSSTAGGTILLPPRTCTFSNQWATSYVNATTVRYLGIKGAGFAANGSWNPPIAATVVEHDYSGGGAAKADFQHVGTVEMTGFLMQDTSGGSVPFVLCTNASPQIHDMGFRGSKTGTSCNQDAIILGGTTTSIGAGDTAPFQGYGGTVRGCFFDGIRRPVLGQTFCNGVNISHNTVSSSCGTGVSGGGCIELNGPGGGTVDAGNTIAWNTIEVSHYPYAIRLINANQNVIVGNGAYDDTGTTLAIVRCESGSVSNIIIDGFHGGTKPALSDANSSVSNQVVSGQSAMTQYAMDLLIAANLKVAVSSTQSGALVFTDTGTGEWQVYTLTGDDHLYFRDLVNARMHITLTQGSTAALAVTEVNSSLKVDGNFGAYGTSPIAQPSSAGTATGYTAGSTSATFHSDDTYSGNTGTTKYTVNGIVAALKGLGLIAS